jgi:hypothetical protein
MPKQHPAPALWLEPALNHALPHATAPTQLHPYRLELRGRYCNVTQSLDFSAGGGDSGVAQSLEDEVNHYITSTIPPKKATDMIGYWMVCFRNLEMLRHSLTSTQHHGKMTWPNIFCLFADYAPIQATSVPSERVISSSAETDTKRRNRISPALMESLQMLKFNFKKAWLNFMPDWQSVPVPDDVETGSTF